MAFPALASVPELEAWTGSPVHAERASAILAAASTLIRSSTARMWVGADGEPEPGLSEVAVSTAKTVCLTVAARAYANPDGTTQQQSGPFSKSVAAWSASGLVLRPEERSMLQGVVPGVPGLSSVRVVAPSGASASRQFAWDWLDDSDTDET